MPNKRYALIVRLWQVQGNSILDISSRADSDPTLEADVPQPIHATHHWRGSLQLVGESKIHYFDSVQEITRLLEQMVAHASVTTNVSDSPSADPTVWHY